ncbi:hypothetical protein OG402_41185 [Streptomyces anulatus]|uniref:hypothetical protein n=1 Tax=Streptomyces anulatus TaxID=1892 RepID=UPI00224FAB68|nr:hypothetical protein [Streptomyces anulatus]MCX4606844.1 hypothetical protein [Streptomyces anulatus]
MIARAPVTMAFSALLASATGIPVGRGRKPSGNHHRYYLLHSIGATYSGAPYSDLNEDATFVYQLTPVSAPDPTRPDSHGVADQAEWMADKAREVAYGRDPATGLWLHQLVIPGARVMGRGPDAEPGGSSDPADAIMSYVQRFRFDLTSA